MAAAGRVATGFSHPMIADYVADGTTVSYENPAVIARGVEVSLSPESADDNIFFADNVAAESMGGIFTGGNVTYTVDGLFTAMKKRIFGYSEPDEEGWTSVGEDAAPPYLGTGYVTRYMSAGVTTYVPTVLTKVKFGLPEESATTQEDEIDFQTTELEATLMRDDSENHNWKLEGKEYPTEAEAIAALEKKLGKTSGGQGGQ